VEDAHRADAASIELLRFLMDRLNGRALMLLVTQRPSAEAAGAFTAAQVAQTTLRLAPLSGAESEALLAALLGGDSPPRLRELVVARAGGNPYFLEEIVRGLIDSGALVREGERWITPERAGAPDIPLTVQGLILARIDRLPRAARRLVRDAAVLGPGFCASLLGAIAREPQRVAGALDALCETEILRELAPAEATGIVGSGPYYRFVQTLVQEVIYQNRLLSRRTERHGVVARVLEATFGDTPEQLEVLTALGYHYGLSDDRRRGARYSGLAGDRARAIYANADALSLYRRALATLDGCGVDEREKQKPRENVADLLAASGAGKEALELYETALATAAAGEQRAAQARICRKIGLLLWNAGERDAARARCEVGLKLLDVYPLARVEAAHFYHEMGRLAFRSGEYAEAADWADRVIAAADAALAGSGDAAAVDEVQAVVSHAQNTRGVALPRLSRPVDAVR